MTRLQCVVDIRALGVLNLPASPKRPAVFIATVTGTPRTILKSCSTRFSGENNFVNEIVWKRSDAKSDVGLGAKHFGRVYDRIFA
jgi:hypothetical protein